MFGVLCSSWSLISSRMMSMGSGVVGGAGIVVVSRKAELKVTGAAFGADGRFVGTLKFLTGAACDVTRFRS